MPKHVQPSSLSHCGPSSLKAVILQQTCTMHLLPTKRGTRQWAIAVNLTIPPCCTRFSFNKLTILLYKTNHPALNLFSYEAIILFPLDATSILTRIVHICSICLPPTPIILVRQYILYHINVLKWFSPWLPFNIPQIEHRLCARSCSGVRKHGGK